ncbi:MAG: hypothetical protein J07HX5_01551 [halophilic archaeon J07HX5]|nr:MAG: hypothetical protein J07HX5_01551 [halophilic archaeon J07HX5]
MNKRVVDQTRSGDWSGQIIENPHDSNIAFYKHVGSIAQIQETQTELLEHFEQFGHEYTSV